MAQEYCYLYVCGGKPSWPDQNFVEEDKNKVDAICDELEDLKFDKPVTTITLSANPGKFLPALSSILKRYERMYDDGVPSEELPRLFSSTPISSFRWRFVTININVLSAITKQTMVSSYENQLESFLKVFDLSGFKIRR